MLIRTKVALVCAVMVASTAASPVETRMRCTDCKWSQNWELVSRMNVSGVLPVYKYRSKRTGITIVLAQADSPVVNGYFCLATEAWKDDGLPHTLEHLIFLGSEDYPYKEVLDLMANRCLADRTNAWTDTDHTCYTVYTAGSGGFLNILPIYLDHILYPLLREEDFLTEVHHVSGTGDDSGVVYSEMQGVENKASNIIYFDMIKQLYPGNTSYEVQTGGRLQNLRESTSIENVRKYHQKFYRPENLLMTVTGNIDTVQLFAALDPVEQKILAKRSESQPPNFERPFQQDLEELTEDKATEIRYPSEEEKFGWVAMAWRVKGKMVDNIESIHALTVLGSYLSSTSVSPLMHNFVDIAEPLATDVDIDLLMNSEPAISIDFENVPIPKMKSIDKKFKQVLQEIQNAGPDKLDMDRIHTLIKRMVLAHKMNLENSPHLVVPDPAVLDLLYGNKPDDMKTFLKANEESSAKDMLAKPAAFWLNLLNETFSKPRVITLAYPSAELNRKMVNDEANRLKEQKERMGTEGLKKAAETLEAAIKSQKPPPPEVLKSVPVASVDLIKFRKLNYYNYTSSRQPDGFALRSIPFRFHLDDMDSQFVRFYMYLDTNHLSQEDRYFLVLLTEVWLQSPLRNAEDGSIEPLESVIKRRSRDTLSFYNDLGYKGSTYVPGSHSHLMMFYAESMMDKYKATVDLLRHSLFNVEFTTERIKTILSQLLNAIPRQKLSASKINSALSDNMYFNDQTNIHFASLLRQQKFLQTLSRELKDNPARLIAKLHQIRSSLVRPENVFVYMATNLERLKRSSDKNPAEVWKTFFPAQFTNPSANVLSQRYPTISEHEFRDQSPRIRHVIAGLPGTESCYMKQSVPYNVVDWELQELAAMRVMLQYLSDRMYDQIRGQGWTYGVSVTASVTEGRIRLTFSRSSQLALAYREFRDIVSNYTSKGANQWDPDLLASAKGSQIYNWAEREETIEDLSSSSMKAYLRQTFDPYYNRRFVKKLDKVSIDDVQKVARKYLPLFLDPTQVQTSVVCGLSDVGDINSTLAQFGIDMAIVEDLENSILTE